MVATPLSTVFTPAGGDATGIRILEIVDSGLAGRTILAKATSQEVKDYLNIVAADIKDSSVLGRTLLTSSSPAAINSALGLGTAALLNHGTSAGQVPVLDASGKLAVGVMPVSAITNANLANMPIGIKGANVAGPVLDLTPAQVTAMLVQATVTTQGMMSSADKAKLDGLAPGIAAVDWKDSVHAASTTNINLASSAAIQIDGMSYPDGTYRILFKDQSSNNENGIYDLVVSGTGSVFTWSRSADANSSALLNRNATCYVDNGAQHSGKAFILSSVVNNFAADPKIWIQAGGKIPAGSVGVNELQDGSVTPIKVQSGSNYPINITGNAATAGTAAVAINANAANTAITATNANHALTADTASVAVAANTANHALTADTASVAVAANTANYATVAGSAPAPTGNSVGAYIIYSDPTSPGNIPAAAAAAIGGAWALAGVSWSDGVNFYALLQRTS